MERHAHVPKIGKTLGHWLLEGLFIVISVALGFWVTQVREERQNHELAARVLKGLQGEVQPNLATLEPFIGIQQKWLDAMGKLGPATDRQTGFPVCPTSATACGVFFATRPDLGGIKTSFPVFRRAAWDTALSTGALRLVDTISLPDCPRSTRCRNALVPTWRRWRVTEGVRSGRWSRQSEEWRW